MYTKSSGGRNNYDVHTNHDSFHYRGSVISNWICNKEKRVKVCCIGAICYLSLATFDAPYQIGENYFFSWFIVVMLSFDKIIFICTMIKQRRSTMHLKTKKASCHFRQLASFYFSYVYGLLVKTLIF
jgi:hypothetical protein